MKVKHCLSIGIPMLAVFFLMLFATACDDNGLEAIPIDDEVIIVVPGPICDNCQPVNAVLNECFHWATDPNGAACSKNFCIKNVLNSASCTRHANQNGLPDCDTKTVNGPEIIQTAHSSSCPGGVVNYQLWKTLWHGCSNKCNNTDWFKACETNACGGQLVLGPANRGKKKACGC